MQQHWLEQKRMAKWRPEGEEIGVSFSGKIGVVVVGLMECKVQTKGAKIGELSFAMSPNS